MTLEQFCRAVYTIGRAYDGSVTSWGRTNVRTVKIGGFVGDPHTHWVGVDMVYDGGPPPFDELSHRAAGLGLKVLREDQSPHDHYQPLDMVAGPITTYDVG